MRAKVPIRANSASGDDKDRIKAELSAILVTEHFSNGKRYPAFLTYIVQKALNGRSEELKERSIGIDVFKRRPDFDTSADTVVRFTAGEVRKRLHSIYLIEGRAGEVQIDPPVGSYVPEFFRLIAAHDAAESQGALDHHIGDPASANDTARSRNTWSFGTRMILAGLFCSILIVIGLLRFRIWPVRTSLERFWQPVYTSSTPIIAPGAFVISRTAPDPDGRLAATEDDAYPYTSMATVEAIANISTVLTRQHSGYILQHSGAVTLSDMRQHPVIFIGGYDNEWTLRLADKLRFRFSQSPRFQIYDSMNPSDVWTRPMENPNYGNTDDYAIAARMHDALTENTVVLIAGISKNGTASASQFVTSSQYLDMLDRPPTKDWAQKNLEILLKTTVIGGKIGPPTIEKVYLW